jgi:hypothetical protein
VNNSTVQGSAVIVNNASGKALDVPGATFSKGRKAGSMGEKTEDGIKDGDLSRVQKELLFKVS